MTTTSTKTAAAADLARRQQNDLQSIRTYRNGLEEMWMEDISEYMECSQECTPAGLVEIAERMNQNLQKKTITERMAQKVMDNLLETESLSDELVTNPHMYNLMVRHVTAVIEMSLLLDTASLDELIEVRDWKAADIY